MEALVEFGKIILPVGAVLYGVFLIVRAFINKELDNKLLELKNEKYRIGPSYKITGL